MSARAPLRPGIVIRIRDQRWRVAGTARHGDVSVLDVVSCDPSTHRAAARFLVPFERIDLLPHSSSPRVVRPAQLRQVARRELAAVRPWPEGLVAAAAAGIEVLPFQLAPALAVLRGAASRVLLADDVGLGKTIQAGVIAAELLARHRDGHALVVCPAGLREQWRQELSGRFGLDAAILDAPSLRRREQHGAGFNPWTAAPVAIASSDFVKRPEVIRAVEGLVWEVVIFDEAHTLAGLSDRAAAAGLLAARARVVLLVSATPHSGDDQAFARLSAIGAIDDPEPALVFRRTRAAIGLHSRRRSRWLRVQPSAAEREMHDALADYACTVWQRRAQGMAGARLAMALLTRRAYSSAASLARSLERRLDVLGTWPVGTAQLTLPFDPWTSTDEEPVGALAVPGLDDLDQERAWLRRLLRLAERAAVRESKIAVLRRILSRTAEPILVFTEYRDTLATLANALASTPSMQLHGGLTTSERREAVERFQSGRTRLLLATDAASEGLNLHHRCRLVVNLELPWTPLRLEQRIGRVDRIGQPLTVHAIQFVARSTPEETVVQRLTTRAERARAALDGVSVETDEAAVANAVLAGIDPILPRRAPGRDEPHATASAFDAIARDEAARIQLARRLVRGPTPPRREATMAASCASRPAIGLVTRRGSRRSHSSVATCYWAFRLDLVDVSGDFVWHTFAALSAAIDARPERTAHAARQVLDHRHVLIRLAVDTQLELAMQTAQAALAAPLARAAAREQAIIDDLRRSYARMGARLLQPGLFDRRAERAATEQATALNEALARCFERIETIERRRRLSGESRLAFAVAHR